MKLNYGSSSGEAGKVGHAKLRAMVMRPSELARGQDALRAQLFDVTKVSGGSTNSSLEHDVVPHSHSRSRGSVAPSRPKR